MNDFIGLDLGTGAIKGVRWNPRQGVIQSVSERVNFRHPEPGWVEIAAEDYCGRVLRLIGGLAADRTRPVAGIAMAAASGNTLLCDDGGAPLTPIISWLDKRLDWTPPAAWRVREVTGWPAIPMFPLMHLEWFRREHPAWLRQAKIGMNNDFLTWRLSGRRAVDASSATPFYLLDQARGCWHQAYLEYYGIAASQLPELVRPGTVIGALKAEYASGALSSGAAIVAGSFDHPAAARAAGVTAPGDMLLSCGTSWVGFYPVLARGDVPENELCDPFQSGAGGCWGGMFSLEGVGLEIERFVLEQYGNTAERYQRFNADALQADTPACRLMRSVIARFAECLGSRRPRRLVMVGGPAEGTAWPKLAEEMLHIPIAVSPYRSYAGAVGAAMLAGGVTI